MNALLTRTPVLSPASWAKLLEKRLCAFARGESGAAAMFFALSSPVWLGGMALGAEVGTWYYQQQRLQSTADIVASSIAGRAGTGALQGELNALASHILQRNNYDFSRGSVEVTLSTPPVEPVFVNGNTVNVQLTRTIPRLLTGIFQPGDFVIQANAAAQVTMATQGCVLALRIENSNAGVSLGALANIQVDGCEVLSNGETLRVGLGSSLAGDCARSRRGITLLSGAILRVNCRNGQPEQNAGLTLDPYANLEDVNVALTCADAAGPTTIGSTSEWNKLKPTPIAGRSYVRLCNSMTIRSSGMVSIPNWTFIFDGADFIIDNTNVAGNALSFYFAGGGRPRIDAANSRVVLSGAAAAAGMLFRGARANTLATGVINDIAVGPGSNLRGGIYFPASDVRFQANGNVSTCLQIIGSTLNLNGTWQVTGPCTTMGLRPIVASREVRLTQ